MSVQSRRSMAMPSSRSSAPVLNPNENLRTTQTTPSNLQVADAPIPQSLRQTTQTNDNPALDRKPIRKKREKEPERDIILDANSAKIDVHSKIRLFPHQQALTAQMIQMESAPRDGKPFIGVLKDPPGSGKSYALLALMLYEKRQFGRTQNLLVIPHNIHKQWLKYIEDFSDELHAMSLMYYGDITSLHFDAHVLFEYDILITTSTFYDMITSTVSSIGVYFNRVVMDEIDSISFFTLNAMPSQAVWLVSASAELTKNGVYKEAARKNAVICDPLFIKRSINLPPPLVEHHTCFNDFVSLIQQGVFAEDALKAVYAVDYSFFKFTYLRNEDVITNPKQLLSAKFRDDALALQSTIDSIETLQRGAKYQSYLPPFLQQKMDQKDALQTSVNKILQLMGRKKCAMCCNDYAMKVTQEEVVDGVKVVKCAQRKRGKTKCCRTLFCYPCMEKWMSKTTRCPKCCKELIEKKDLAEKDLLDKAMELDTDVVEPETVQCEGLLDKMETFEIILKKEIAKPGFRILIFSDRTGTFLKVQDILKECKLQFAEIEGNQFSMDKAMSDYRSGKKPILLVDAQSYGAGMSMPMTTAVVIMHKTERENQVIGRAQRLGRTDRLKVHHLLYANE